MTPTEELTRAGITEVSPGVFKKATNARRTVSKATAAGAGVEGHPDSASKGSQDSRESSELPHTELQEREAVDNDPAEWEAAQEAVLDSESAFSGMERGGHTRFRISVALKVSNYGRRDPTGALETIADLITATRRRLSERLAARQLDSRVSFARKRGSGNHSGKTVKFKPTLPPLF